MIQSVQVIGAGRVGSAVAARLAERGVDLDAPAPGLVLLRVPDTALRGVAASVASNFLVTLQRIAARLVCAAGAPPEALVPLIRSTVENGFELTGPVQRGDWQSVERQRAAIAAAAPDLRPVFDALVAATAEV